MSHSKDLLKKALNELKKGDTSIALKFAQKVLDLYPESPEAGAASAIVDKLAPEETKPSTQNESIKTKYGIARGSATVIEIIGGFIMLAGFVAIIGVIDSDSGAFGYAVAIGIGGLGTLLIMVAQVVKAMVDTADHTREIFELLKAQNL